MRIFRFFVIIFIALLVGYYVGITKINLDWKNYHPRLEISSKEPPAAVSKLDMAKFWSVMEKVEESFYNKSAIDPQKMLDGAISGMVNSLDDPYTLYLPPVQNANFKEVLSGQFSGIGAELGLKEKQIIVVAPIDGSPAEKAGIKAGDAILKVDDAYTLGWTLTQAVEKIRGPRGSVVALTILHTNEKDPQVLKITRDTITIKSVTSYVKPIDEIDSIKPTVPKPTGSQKNSPTPTPSSSPDLISKGKNKVAYIRLSQYGDNTNQEWLSMSNGLALKIQKDTSIKGIVLDLRNNPGGYVSDAVFISSEFLPIGTKVVIQDMGAGGEETLSVKRNGLLLNVPLVVLINKGSASAAEITAGSLRDAKRALLVGEQSFGKGTMQNTQDLGQGSGLHVTIARWLTPKGTWVGNGKDGKGLTPDVVVELDPKNPTHDTQLEKAIEKLVE